MGSSNQNVPATRIGVFGTQNNLLGTAAVSGFTPTPCVIGKTFGADTVLSNQPILRLAHPTTEDLLAYNTVERIISVSDVLGGIANYVNNVDYALDNATNPDSISWLGTFISPPTGVALLAGLVVPTAPRTGLAANTYYYKISAIRQIALPSTNGETTPSVEQSVVVGGPNNSVELSWTPVVNAQGYNIYRSTASGVYVNTLIATVLGGASNSFLDDGYTTGAGTPVGVNTARNMPADGATYYVTYEAVIFNYFNPVTYFSLNDLIADHGLGSDVVIAGTLILGGTGLGQGASKCMVVSLPDVTEASFLQALTNISTLDVQYVVPLVDDDAVALDVMNHCIERSSTLGQHPRFGIFGATRGTPLGDPTTVDSIVWKGTRLVIDDTDGVPQGRRGQFVDNSGITMNVIQADGKPISVALDGWFLAAAHAGLVCALSDTATSGTFKQLQGIASLDFTFTDNQRDFLQQNGLLTYFVDTGGIIKCYQDRTLDTLIVENQERSIVSADDQIFRDLLAFFKAYVGRKITDQFKNSLKTGTDKVLGNELSAQILATYQKDSIVVTQPFADKRIVIVTFTYTPIYPANQIIFQRAFNV